MALIKKFVEEFALLCDTDVTDEMTELAKKFYKASQKSKKEVEEKSDKEKKKPNSYILFCMGERKHFIEENPDKKPKEITQLMGASWTAEKTKNSDLYQQYTEEYKSSSSDDEEKPKPKPKKEKVEKSESEDEEAGKKKRDLTSYNIFCSNERLNIKKEHPDMPSKEYMTELGKRWKELSQERKDAYKDGELSPKKVKEVKVISAPLKPKEKKDGKKDDSDVQPQKLFKAKK